MPIRVYRCPKGHEQELIQLHGESYPAFVPCEKCEPEEPPAKNVPARAAIDTRSFDRNRYHSIAGTQEWEPGLDRDCKRVREARQERFEKELHKLVGEAVAETPNLPPD